MSSPPPGSSSVDDTPINYQLLSSSSCKKDEDNYQLNFLKSSSKQVEVTKFNIEQPVVIFVCPH